MPQVLKDEVRARILDGALEVFARDGFEAATMASIAKAAGVSAASIYRYYDGKDELFAAVITPEMTTRFEALLERRISGLARNALRGASADDAGGEMLQFWLEHRLAVVILLDRAAGTPHARYGERFVALLVKHTLAELRDAHAGLAISARARFVLSAVFDNTRRILATILAAHERPADLREAIATFWSYQLAGMRGLSEHLAAARHAK